MGGICLVQSGDIHEEYTRSSAVVADAEVVEIGETRKLYPSGYLQLRIGKVYYGPKMPETIIMKVSQEFEERVIGRQNNAQEVEGVVYLVPTLGRMQGADIIWESVTIQGHISPLTLGVYNNEGLSEWQKEYLRQESWEGQVYIRGQIENATPYKKQKIHKGATLGHVLENTGRIGAFVRYIYVVQEGMVVKVKAGSKAERREGGKMSMKPMAIVIVYVERC